MLAHKKKTESLKDTIKEIIKVSTVPAILKKVLEVVENENSKAAELEAVIERDQAISSRIVCMANSPYYGLPRKVSNLSQAIVVLGFSTVKSLAITISVFKNIKGGPRFDVRELWVHSLKVAMASSLIAERTGSVNRDSAFLAGLLHDIGRALLFQIYGEKYEEVSLSTEDNLLLREKEAFGADHAEAGAWFAEKCRLPEDSVDSIRHHHSPGHCTASDSILCNLLPVVYSADILAAELSKGFENDSFRAPRHEKILRSIGLDAAVAKDVTCALSEADDAIRAFFSSDD